MRLGDLSIRQKLVGIQILTAFTVLVLVSAYYVMADIRSSRTGMVQRLGTTATIIGLNTASSLKFLDRGSAAQILAFLEGDTEVLHACVYDAEGGVFATYPGEASYDWPAPQARGHQFRDQHLLLFQPIVDGDETLGTVFLVGDMQRLRERVEAFVISALLLLAAGIGVAALLSTLLQRQISRPILDLADATRRVTATGDMTDRVASTTGGEIGQLYDDFNAMLEQIHQRDAELRRAQDVLESRVEERTGELSRSNVALEEARDEALAASRAKSDFLANMSHELRTPMNGIIGTIELMLDRDLPADVRHDLQTVNASSELLLGLINDVLDLSKIEAGKLQLERTEFMLWDVLDSILKLMAQRAHEKGLELIGRADPDVPARLVGDPVRLRQVIANLVGNAIKFTERGYVLLSVSCPGRTDDGVRLEVSVTDTGIGVEPERQAEIFEAFEQADTSTTRRFGGTGLGLSISTQLVQLMGGRIGLDSEFGRGSTFTFSAPLAVAPQPDPTPPPAMAGLSVLIVDDSDKNREVLAEMLSGFALAPAQAADGEEALRWLQTRSTAGESTDLVLLDAVMPGMDGLTLAQRIREAGGPRPKLILLTSTDDPDDVERAREVGVEIFLRKPVTPAELLEALRAAGGEGTDGSHVSNDEGPVELESLSVLLAEDNPVNRRVATGLLKSRGHSVDAVVNGREAVASATGDADGYDLVLMDLQMPEMGGLDATRRIRELQHDSGRHTPIIGLTANAMTGDRQMCLDAGMDGYISKPVRRDALFSEIARVLSGLRDGAAAAQTERAEPAAPEDPVVDESVLAELEELEDEGLSLQDLIDIFATEGRRYVEAMTAALGDGRGEDLHRAAHTLKGSGYDLGTPRLARICQQVESLARDDDFAGVAPLLEDVGAAFDEALVHLQRYQTQRKA